MKEGFSGRDLLGVEAVAEYLGVQHTTVYRWCREGRLACFKVGKSWRIRRGAVEEFVKRKERPATLAGQLRKFLDAPATVLGLAQNTELLHRLDAAFLQVGAERGGALIKFYGGEPATVEELRRDFERGGLDVSRLEDEGRLMFSAERNPLEERESMLRRLVEEQRENGREVWASFDWVENVDLESVLRQQQALMEFANRQRLSVKTAMLEKVADKWPIATQRRAQALHSGVVWVSDSGLSLSRMLPVATS